MAVNSVRSGRFLDTPEYLPMHDIGNNLNIFDRLDFQPTPKDTLHLNLFFARSWFQIPNTYDQQSVGQDQRQQVFSYNFAPGWVRVISPDHGSYGERLFSPGPRSLLPQCRLVLRSARVNDPNPLADQLGC